MFVSTTWSITDVAHLLCQIADFGLSKKLDDNTEYYVIPGGKVPVNWTAPEVYGYPAALQGYICIQLPDMFVAETD